MHKRVGSDPASERLKLFQKIYRIISIVLISGAIVWQLIYSITHYPTFNVWNFFSFFTIDSNVIAVVALIWLLLARKQSSVLQIFRGATTLYMAITGIVFAILLSNIEVQLTLPAVDLILHKIAPIIIILDWLIDPPRLRFTVKQISWWFIFPIAWFVYTLLRGLTVGWYPYPFLDPRSLGGYGQVSLYCIAILVLGMLVAWLLTLIARVAGSKH